MTHRFPIFLVLAATQITGWGVVGILPVVAPVIAGDLRTTLPLAFTGVTIMFVAMGLSAPLVGRAFRTLGVKKVMAGGAGGIGLGLALLGMVQSVAVYLAVWGLIGIAGAMFLTTAAYAYLADFAHANARGMIGSLMLVTGLAGSVFWPLTAWLEHLVGWRGVTEIYACVMLMLVTPLILFGLPKVDNHGSAEETGKTESRRGRVFWFLVTAIALNSFVTFGMDAIGIELFRVLGAEPAMAVGMASFLGVLKVSGRLIDLAGGKRWSAISTGLVAGAMIPAGLLVLLVFGGNTVSVLTYLVLFGIGSGAFAVARATTPLIFYSKTEYAAAMSAIALPMNLSSATAAPILSGLLSIAGPVPMLSLLILCSGLALCLLIGLDALRKREIAGVA